MKSLKRAIFIVLFLVAIGVIYFINSEKSLYGNDKESIIKVIKSIEGYESKEIEIIEMKDLQDSRFVGFLADNDPSYIEFIKNNQGHYEWKSIEVGKGKSFALFLFHPSSNEETSESMTCMIVTNQQNQIAKMEMGVNGEVVQQNFNVSEKSVSWFDVPDSKENSYKFTYKYFDVNGYLIDEN